MKALHQPPAELREALALPQAKRARRRNQHRRWGYDQFTWTKHDQRRATRAHRLQKSSTALPVPVS